MSLTEPPNPEDQRIVEIARELCRELSMTKLNPESVYWLDSLLVRVYTEYADLMMPVSDYCFVVRKGSFSGPMGVQIAKALKGKLEPEEFRPLIASSLILRQKIRSKQFLGYMLITIFLPIFLTTLIAFIVVKNVPATTISVGSILILILAAFLFPWSRFMRYYKKIWLMADEQAAELVGRENLLHVLRKIDGLGLKDLEKLKGRGFRARTRRWSRPSVPERIENLQALELTS